MIKAEELKIGNLLNWNTQNKHGNVIIRLIDGLDLYKWQIDPEYSKDYSPIPLTPEILEKAGFLEAPKDDPYGFWLYDIGQSHKIRIMQDEFKQWVWNNQGFIVPIPFAHTLQNLIFSLTNSELTINI